MSAMQNQTLTRARKNKNDEYYTLLSDIKKELSQYPAAVFKNQVVYCNCDSPKHSQFWHYFHDNFKKLGLKKLMATYLRQPHSYLYEFDGNTVSKRSLRGDGDFRSSECVNLLHQAGIIVTNPPFSLARPFLKLLFEYKKPFILVGDLNWVTLKHVFPYFKSGRIRPGYCQIKSFVTPSGKKKHFGNKQWFTSIPIKKTFKPLNTGQKYSKDAYPRYDNYNAIEVKRSGLIPMDYDGVMGVPVSFINKLNPAEFKLLDITDGKNAVKHYASAIHYTASGKKGSGSAVNSRATLKAPRGAKSYYIAQGIKYPLVVKYARLLIQKKK